MPILHVVGARPNFMKAAPVWQAFASRGVAQVLIHTGQHYDEAMSEVFFEQLGLPQPDENLGVGSASHGQQTASIMTRFEPVLQHRRPSVVMVYGDVNSTIAAALVAAKLGVPVAHVEAGLRSFDRSMPEEINRILTDQIADLLFTPSKDGDENLAKEGIPAAKVHLVGNVMIDTLVRLLPQANPSPAVPSLPSRYLLVTLHRPGNVDDPAWLEAAMTVLKDFSEKIPVVFPVHPRTRQKIAALPLPHAPGLMLLDPVSYLDFLGLQKRATAVITDSGGVQEETTYLGIPCLTLRDNTERPVTISRGTNILVGRDLERLRVELDKVLTGQMLASRRQLPPLWDGYAGERIADITMKWQKDRTP